MAIDFRAMDKKKLAIIAFAIGAGLIAVVLTNSYIEETSREKAKILGGGMSSAETKKLLARVDNLEKINQDVIARQNALIQAQQATAQKAQTVQKPQMPSLAVRMPVGKRAITATIEKLNAIGGLISPGDTVDIIVHLTPQNAKDSKQAMAVTLFQNVLVLAVGSNIQPGSGYEAQQNLPTIPITFALSPQEAGLMSFAQQHGKLQIVLRPPLESQAYILPVATWDSLAQYILDTQGTVVDLRGTVSTEPTKPTETKPQIEVFRGGR